MNRIYMDHNATTPLHPLVAEAMQPYLDSRFGNPSSTHWAGRPVREAVEKARQQVAALVHCAPDEVIFTSCATESNNTVIKGVALSRRHKGRGIVTTMVEHPSVMMPCYFLEPFGYIVHCLDVDRRGQLDLQALEEVLTEETILLTAMFANNETGTVFPIRRMGELAARRGILFHCDAAQAVGKIPVDFKADGIDFMSLSGHKLYGPKGTGALIVRRGVKVPPLLHGGSQEKNRRAGTENVAGIVGLGQACALAAAGLATEGRRLEKLRDRLEGGLLANIAHVRRNGDPDNRLPNTANLSFLHIDSDALLRALDRAGIALSSVSACSSGSLKTSRVLEAMGVVEGTQVGTLRFSLGRDNTAEDVSRVLEVVQAAVERLRSGSAGA